MGLLSRITQARTIRADASGDPWDDFWYQPAGFAAMGGQHLTPEAALTLSSVWRAVRIYMRTIGSMPLITYRSLERGGHERAKRHPLYDVLRWQPNHWQTAIQFWGMCLGHLKLRGNFYAQIVPGPRGFADQLIPRHPDRMLPEMLPSGTLRFKWTPNGGPIQYFTQDEIFHVCGPTLDGLRGLSMVEYGASSFSAGLSAETFAGRFFKQGATSSLALVHPETLGPEASENLRKSVSSYVTGLDNAHGVLILEEGMEPKVLGIKPEDAQLISTREFTIDEVARWADLPASMLGNAKTPTYASQESFRIELVVFSLEPDCTLIEQAIRRDLILKSETYYAEFLFEKLLRGDSAARAQFYKSLIEIGVMTRNEAREKENLNPLDGLDAPLEPLNMGRAGEPRDGEAPVDGRAIREQAIAMSKLGVRAALFAHDAASRVVRKELAAVTKAAQRFAKDPDGFAAWLRPFYDELASEVAVAMRMPLSLAREYAGEHGLALEQRGVTAMANWDQTAPAALVTLADRDAA